MYYIAAMRPFGEGSAEKIARHRRMRAEKGFMTIERYTDLAGLTLFREKYEDKKPAALLECIANLTANEMFDDEGNVRDPFGPVVSGVRRLAEQCSHLVVVTNDVGSDGGGYGDLTEEYVRTVGKINAVLAQEADAVCEMVFGCPTMLKGKMPEGKASGAARSAPEDHTDKKDRKNMLLIVGAEGSGKRTFAEKLGYDLASDRVLLRADELVKGIAAEDAATVAKKDVDARVDAILSRLGDHEVIIANEVGSGVIPLEPEVRREREAAGRLVTLLAKRADTVVRMVCGIPTVLKGSLPEAPAE